MAVGFVECSSMRSAEHARCARILAASFEHRRARGRSSPAEAETIVVREDGLARGLGFLRERRVAFGGEFVRTACLSSLCVARAHRSRGLGGELVQGLVDTARRRSIGLALLIARDERLYARHGFARCGSVGALAFDPPRRASRVDCDPLRPREPADAPALASLAAIAARERTACVLLSDSDRARRSQAPRRTHVCERDGAIVASITWSVRLAGGPATLYVHELLALDRRAADSIWAFVASQGENVSRVRWRASVDDPCVPAAGLDRARFELRGSWMARVIDARRVLGERGFPRDVEAEFHFALLDPASAENRAPFVLRVAAGRASVAEGGRGSIRTDIQTFAGLCIGAVPASKLRAEGRLFAPDGCAEPLDAAFALGPSTLHWLP